MKCIGKYIFISYDKNDRFKHILPGGIEIIVPDKWTHIDEWGAETDKVQENLDYKEVNPQVGYVIGTNPSFGFQNGDKVFFHYLAIVFDCEVDGQAGAFINAEDVFFVDNGAIQMVDGVYLGKQVFDPIEQTASGIYLGHIERKVEKRVRLTHLPPNSPHQIGDEVLSIDRFQYNLTYNGEQYVKLREIEIVAYA